MQNFDKADLVIPNSNLVTNQVINWTRTDRLARIKMPVGVAYGSDVPLVMKILQECAAENKSVAKSYEPRVIFMGFGDSSLDFELRVHLQDSDPGALPETDRDSLTPGQGHDLSRPAPGREKSSVSQESRFPFLSEICTYVA